jgi:hypothetical protein
MAASLRGRNEDNQGLYHNARVEGLLACGGTPAVLKKQQHPTSTFAGGIMAFTVTNYFPGSLLP